MSHFFRAAITAFTVLGALFFTYWMAMALLPAAFPDLVPFAIGVVAAAGAGRFVWSRASVSGGLVSAVCTGAFATGAIAFVAGFFGPMLLTPEGNQGPLLGIFVTGPLGFLAGAVGGAVYWAMRRQRDQL